jgi:hypothetical protein
MNYARFDPSTGRILATGQVSSQAQMDAQGSSSVAVDATVGALTHYVVAGVATLRPPPALDTTTVAANGTSVVTLSGLADPATVLIDGVSNSVSGGTTPIAFSIAGVYEIEVVESFPHTPFSATVTAT